MYILIFCKCDINIVAALTVEGCGYRWDTAAFMPTKYQTPSALRGG